MNDKMIDILLMDDAVEMMNGQRAVKSNNSLNSLHRANRGLEALAILRNQGADSVPSHQRLILLNER